MESTRIRVDLSKRELRINERKIRLEDSLVDAEILRIPNSGYDVLNLKYAEQREGPEPPTRREMDKLNYLREGGELPEEIEVYDSQVGSTEPGMYTPTLSLVGPMKASIQNR